MTASSRFFEAPQAGSATRGRLIVLEGIPGAGKTTLACALAGAGVAVLGEYTNHQGATLPLSAHPPVNDSDGHDANWLRKATQAAVACSQFPVVYADRDWLSALAYAYSLGGRQGAWLLRRRCEWAHAHLASQTLLLPDMYVVIDLSVPASMRRRTGLLQHDHPWSHPGPLRRLRRFYTAPLNIIGPIHPDLARVLGRAGWHHLPGTAAPGSSLAMLRQLGACP